MATLAATSIINNPDSWAWEVANKATTEIGKYFIALMGVLTIILIFKAFQKG